MLNTHWLNSTGMDLSNVYRGKIMAIKEILQTKNVFDEVDKMEKQLKEAEDKLKGAENGVR